MVAVALAPDLPVGEDVEPGLLLQPDRDDRGVVLRLGEVLGRDAPQLLRPHAGREPARELRAVDQPLGLGVASDQGRRQQRQRHGSSSGEIDTVAG
jgi:hypothetical protein